MAPTRKDYPMIIVTGAAGWLGQRVVSALAEGTAGDDLRAATGVRLRCLVAPQEETKTLRDHGADIVTGDLRDPDTRQALVKDADGALIIHLAGIIHPQGTTRILDAVNHRATLDLLQAASTAHIDRFVVMSSNSPMGANRTPDEMFTEDSPYNPYMGYGLSKYRMEMGLRAAMGRPGMPEIVIARAPWFYGPGQPPRQTQFFAMVRDGKFPLMGQGLNRRSMGFVDTLAQGLILSGRVPDAAGRTYWLADERPYSMREIVDTVKAVLKDDFGMTVSDRDWVLPPLMSDVARLVDRGMQTLGLYHQKIHVLSEMNLTIACDVSRAKKELGFSPLVELREGMRRSIDWCLANGQTI